MSQHDYVIANGTGAAVRSDLNNALAAIVSNNSGATEPTTTYAYMWWPDTTTNTLKLRNGANNAWITLRQLDGDFTTVSVDNGSNSAPSIYFNASGTDTGIYSSGTDAVDIATAGTRRLGVASNGDITFYGGNITLNAQGDLRFADSDSSNWVAFQAPATVASNVTWTLPAADGTSAQVLSTNGSGTLSWASVSSDKISEGNTEAEVVDTGSDGHFKVTTEGSERLRVDPSGRLLIGTSTARSNLYYGATAITPPVQFESVTNTYSTGLSLLNYSGSAYGALLTLGISKTNTQGSNSVVANNDELAIINFVGNDGSNFRTAAAIGAFADAAWGTGDAPGRLVFSTTADGASSPTERMRITQAGNTLIGCTATPGSSVAGAGFIRETNGRSTLFCASSTTGSSELAAFFNPNGQVGAITTSGSATAYNTSSDYRLKENVIAVTDGITRLQQLKPSRFNFIADPDKTVDGFLAHEAAEVVPECVTGEKDAVDEDGNPVYQGIDQSKLVPLLTAALQDAIGEIESLKARVAALETA